MRQGGAPSQSVTTVVSAPEAALTTPSNSSASLSTMIVPAPGVQAISKKMADNMLAGVYVDFAELPPAKGRTQNCPVTDGQIVLVHAAEFMHSKRLIADLSTWIQCFAIYTAVVTSRYPERMPSLMAYMSNISQASSRYRWPSWIVYDINFRQAAAGTGNSDWSKTDPSLYTMIFQNMSIAQEGWCTHCYSTEHMSERCIHKPMARKRPLMGNVPPSKRQGPAGAPQICKKYNIHNGNCSYGSACRYLHACEICSKPGHFRAQCSQAGPVGPTNYRQ